MTGAKRPPVVGLSLAGALLGVAILGIRIAAIPDTRLGDFLVVAGVALLASGLFVAALALGIRRRMRAASREFPAAVVIPLSVGAETAAATRWLATRLGDDAIRLTPGRSATVAVDAAGLHVLAGGNEPFGLVPASALSVGPEQRTLVGPREMDALVLTVSVGDETASLPLVPMRLRGNPFRRLGADERHATLARVASALRGDPVEPGWPY